MLTTSPVNAGMLSAVVDSSFKICTAFCTAEHPGKRIGLITLILCLSSRFNSFLRLVKKRIIHYGRMMIFYEILCFFALVSMSAKMLIGIGLLTQKISGVEFVFQNSKDSRIRPSSISR